MRKNADYFESYAPVVDFITTRFVSVANAKKWVLKPCNIACVFALA